MLKNPIFQIEWKFYYDLKSTKHQQSTWAITQQPQEGKCMKKKEYVWLKKWKKRANFGVKNGTYMRKIWCSIDVGGMKKGWPLLDFQVIPTSLKGRGFKKRLNQKLIIEGEREREFSSWESHDMSQAWILFEARSPT